jgi:hypothetical protein
MALLDACSLTNPRIIGVESSREIIIGDDFVWQGAAPTCDDCAART